MSDELQVHTLETTLGEVLREMDQKGVLLSVSHIVLSGTAGGDDVQFTFVAAMPAIAPTLGGMMRMLIEAVQKDLPDASAIERKSWGEVDGQIVVTPESPVSDQIPHAEGAVRTTCPECHSVVALKSGDLLTCSACGFQEVGARTA